MMKSQTIIPFPLPSLRPLMPGLAASVAVAGTGWLGHLLQQRLFGHVWLDALLLAILLGMVLRAMAHGRQDWADGIGFAAKYPLELAILLLGATLDAGALAAAGPLLLAGIVAIVALSLTVGYGISRVVGLDHRPALLVACGNSICGNSAIVAAAPVIGATARETATALAFTALLGVLSVLMLPLAGAALGLDGLHFGILAGLTVYAVPQVAAATAMTGMVSLHTGMLVKLARVMMLGPVLLILSLIGKQGNPKAAARPRAALLPWFIIGFAGLAALRALGWVPAPLVAPAADASHMLTLLSMAGLGLSVDISGLRQAGYRTIAAASLSLLALVGMSLGLLSLLPLS